MMPSPCKAKNQRGRVAEGLAPPSATLTVELIREADPDGRPVVHGRIVDALERLRRRGVISSAMWHAGRHFQRDFHLAAIAVMPLPRLVWAPGNGEAELTERQADARRRLASAVRVLGGFAAPPTCCVWQVLGEERSLAEFALRQRWAGRPMHWHVAQGMLVAALAVLAAHYGYERA
jgi:hypothetical protein